MSIPLSIPSILAICAIIGVIGWAWARKSSFLIAIVLANMIVFVISIFAYKNILSELGFSPAYLSADYWPRCYTVLTSMFVHGDFGHIIMNMLVLVLIGYSFEQRVGRSKFLLIYLVTGIIGAIFNWGSAILLIGASGAIFGILGAYAVAYPRDRVMLPMGIIFMRVPVLVGAIVLALIETLYVAIGATPGISHLAHLGGFVGGVLFLPLLKAKPTEELKAKGIEGKGIDFGLLQSISSNQGQLELIERIKVEELPEVSRAWLEYLLNSLECPKCGEKLLHDDKILRCKCGFENKYRS
jgi:membrane associated rhomboid family serine protease